MLRGDSDDHPWKHLMLRAWDVLHLYKPYTLLHKLGSIYTNQVVVGGPK